MHRGEQIHLAIQQRDSEILRRIADHARREEDQIFIALLADLVDPRRSSRGRTVSSRKHLGLTGRWTMARARVN